VGRGGGYVAQAGVAYGAHCARHRTHKTMQVVSVHRGRDGRGQPVYEPEARCAACGTAWPRVEANVPRWEVSGGRRTSDRREEALMLKARLETAWEAMAEATDPLIARVYELFACRGRGGYEALALQLSEAQMAGRPWTAKAVRYRVGRARRAFADALAAKRLLREAA